MKKILLLAFLLSMVAFAHKDSSFKGFILWLHKKK